MRIGISAGLGDDIERSVDYVREAERLGAGIVYVAEAWGSDAATQLAFLAARTETITLASGIFQLGVRTPAMTAQTAITLDLLSGGRFVLGLGASGPQVIEGLHGQPFAHPLGRMRETIEVIRQVLRGERVAHDGRHVVLPRPGGEGKSLRVALPPRPDLPIHLATLSPKMLELTGEVADGWIGTSFVPEGAEAYLSHLRAGAERAGRSLDALDLSQGGDVAIDDDVERLVEERRAGLAFSLGGMGSADTNFYNDAYARQGFAEVAERVQRLWVEGKRDEARAAVPDDMVLATTMIGTESMVRDRMQVWKDSGITTMRVYPAGRTLDERLATLARAIDLARTLR